MRGGIGASLLDLDDELPHQVSQTTTMTVNAEDGTQNSVSNSSFLGFRKKQNNSSLANLDLPARKNLQNLDSSINLQLEDFDEGENSKYELLFGLKSRLS